MGFFGSGDKIQSSADNRIGVSDAAQLAQPGAIIFNRSAKADNLAPALNPEQIASYTPAIVAVAGVVALVLLLNRK